jgi:hypothetical protein
MNPDEKIPSPDQILDMLGSSMPARDLENLRFILNLGPVRAAEWMMNLDQDDAAYAMELIQSCTSEIKERILALDDDNKDLDLTEANLVINRIKGTL